MNSILGIRIFAYFTVRQWCASGGMFVLDIDLEYSSRIFISHIHLAHSSRISISHIRLVPHCVVYNVSCSPVHLQLLLVLCIWMWYCGSFWFCFWISGIWFCKCFCIWVLCCKVHFCKAGLRENAGGMGWRDGLLVLILSISQGLT